METGIHLFKRADLWYDRGAAQSDGLHLLRQHRQFTVEKAGTMGFYEENRDDMISYVSTALARCEVNSRRKQKIRYNRFDHTMRVFKWMQLLYDACPEKENIDFDSLAVAALFHDIGYCEDYEDHAKPGAVLCRKYLESRGHSLKKTDFICDLVARHSNKETLFQDIPMELVLLMEADLLDDTGAQALVMDTWFEVADGERATFESILEHMEAFSIRQMQDNPMRTEKGKQLWENKKRLAEAFVEAYREDLRK